MNTNVLKDAGHFQATNDDTNFFGNIVKPLRDFAVALHKAQVVSELVKEGVAAEKAYEAVYKRAA